MSKNSDPSIVRKWRNKERECVMKVQRKSENVERKGNL